MGKKTIVRFYQNLNILTLSEYRDYYENRYERTTFHRVPEYSRTISPRTVSQTLVPTVERYDYPPSNDPRTYQAATAYRPSDRSYDYDYYVDRQRLQATYDVRSYPRQYRSPPRLEYHYDNIRSHTSTHGEYNHEIRPTTQNGSQSYTGYTIAGSHYNFHYPEETATRQRARSPRQE